jgi:hypothetical protein
MKNCPADNGRQLTVLVDFDNEEQRRWNTKEEDAWQNIYNEVDKTDFIET